VFRRLNDNVEGNYGPPRCSEVPTARHGGFDSPHRDLWSSYDAEADVLNVNFKKPSHADDSELTDDDVIVRYEGGEVVGLTILHASQR